MVTSSLEQPVRQLYTEGKNTFEEKEYFSEEYGIDVFNLGGIN